MRPLALATMVIALLAAACTDAEPVASSIAATSTSSASTTTTTTTTTTTAPTTVPAPTSTSAPASTSTTVAPGACPDLFRDDGPDSEFTEVVLAAWNEGTGEMLWEIPLGTRWPSWGVWSDEVVLGFPDGQLVGIGATECDTWSISLAGGIDDLWVTSSGTYITRSGSELAGFSGDGFGNWRRDELGSEFRLAAENAGIAVFVNRAGDLVGLEIGSGETVFEWGGVSDATAVAVSETFLYRSNGAEVSARPAAGGSIAWSSAIAGIDSIYAVPGTVFGHDGDTLHALEPSSGEVRWSIPFMGSISGPIVLDHNELHIASREDSLSHTLWHLEPADGSLVVRGEAPAGKEWFAEMDDEMLLEVGDDGSVLGVTMLQREAFSLSTGANRVSRFTSVELARGSVIVTLSFSAERF